MSYILLKHYFTLKEQIINMSDISTIFYHNHNINFVLMTSAIFYLVVISNMTATKTQFTSKSIFVKIVYVSGKLYKMYFSQGTYFWSNKRRRKSKLLLSWLCQNLLNPKYKILLNFIGTSITKLMYFQKLSMILLLS